MKLHGSDGWLDAEDEQLMVLGGGKEERIGEHPVLEYYLATFQEVLRTARRLFVLGYGFGDPHINRAIAYAVDEHGLQVYLWILGIGGNIQNWLESACRNRELASRIKDSLRGLYPEALVDVFSQLVYGSRTDEERRIYREFFEIELPK